MLVILKDKIPTPPSYQARPSQCDVYRTNILKLHSILLIGKASHFPLIKFFDSLGGWVV